MTSEEIRVGNLLNSDTGLIKVIGIPFASPLETEPFPHKMESRARLIQIMPIDFTEEWLPKLGLSEQKVISKNNDSTIFDFHCGPFFRLSFRKLNPKGIAVKLHTIGNEQMQITSVHHLQNVYFALVGRELEIDYFKDEILSE